jgi:hypothetical protein
VEDRVDRPSPVNDRPDGLLAVGGCTQTIACGGRLEDASTSNDSSSYAAISSRSSSVTSASRSIAVTCFQHQARHEDATAPEQVAEPAN